MKSILTKLKNYWKEIGAIVILLSILPVYYLVPNTIKPELVVEYYQDDTSKLPLINMTNEEKYWRTITDEESLNNFLEDFPSLKDSPELSDIDFEKNNLVVGYGVEIVKIKYRRAEKILPEYSGQPYRGYVTYGDSHENTIFIYKIKKVYVAYDIYLFGV